MTYRYGLLVWVAASGCQTDSDSTKTEECGAPTLWYADQDGDGMGVAEAPMEACDQPAATSAVAGDCDDADPEVFPGASESWYDGLDQDCSGGSDFDQDGDGQENQSTGGTDCDDEDPGVFLGAAEIWYDGIDQDCSGGSDFDQDGDTYDAINDCDDENAEVHPDAAEVWYDGTDQNCSGGTDYDQDADGYEGDDCDDQDPLIHPGTDDVPCNGADDNCDGTIDEVPLALASGPGWVTAPEIKSGWNTVGYDDSGWTPPLTPAADACGWEFTEANLGRPFQAWEHASSQTMWSGDGAAHLYLRRTFELPPGGVVSLAMITTIVDDEHTVYLNGTQIGFDPDPDGIPIVESDFRSALVVGENVLAIDAQDLGGCRWAIADAAISCAQ